MVLFASLGACSGDDASGGGGGGGFCSALGAASTCQGAEEPCRDVLTIDAAADGSCVDQRDAFLGCLTGHDLVCASGSHLYAGPDAASGSSYTLGGYTVQTATDCTRLGDAWVSCNNCREATKRVRDAAETFVIPSDPAATRCREKREAFLACALIAQVTCPDFMTVDSRGPSGTGRTIDDLGGVTVHVTEACGARADEWLSCVYCGGGLGYGKRGRDVGERCDETRDCADGLTCVFDHCTAPCDPAASADVCTGRTWRDGDCRNDAGRIPKCSGIVNACVTSCESNEDCTSIQADGFCPGNGARLEPDRISVEYSVCFFGECNDDYCTPADPFP
jgi:hypothetical protein